MQLLAYVNVFRFLDITITFIVYATNKFILTSSTNISITIFVVRTKLR